MTRTLSATKLIALADLSTVLPRLTTTELRRLLVLAQAMRGERKGHLVAGNLASEALPSVEVTALALSKVDDLITASGALCALRPMLTDESRPVVRAGEDALDDVIQALLDLIHVGSNSGSTLDDLRAVAAALRVAKDAPT